MTLPPNITPGLDPLSSPIGQLYSYTLESDTKGLRELSELQRWLIIPALKQLLGVADITNFGGIMTQYQLELDPQQLVRFNLSLKNVSDGAVLGHLEDPVAEDDVVERLRADLQRGRGPAEPVVDGGAGDGAAEVASLLPKSRSPKRRPEKSCRTVPEP